METAQQRATPEKKDRTSEFLLGVRDQLPILLGTTPFGLIYGVIAVDAGLGIGPSIAMSSIVFAGSAQFIAAELFATATPALVIIVTTFVVNLRHALYSASLAPYVRHLNAGWKWLLAYLLTDEAYATTIVRYTKDGEQNISPNAHWYFFGTAFTLWSSWQVSTAIGALVGTQIPAGWSLDFTVPLVFIALVMPTLTDRAAMLAALSAGVVAIVAISLPFNLSLIVAAFVGIIVGLTAEAFTR